MIAEDRRWEAVRGRDRAADGSFVYAVRTTGVYCRPSCPARRPNRANVVFFDDGAEAARAGFRACRRCGPGAGRGADEPVVRACRLIEQAEAPPTLEALGHAVGLSPWHLQRRFKAAVGVSPRDYAEQVRAGRLRDRLQAGGDVAGAVFEAGFGSLGRGYAAAGAALGMTPARYRRGGDGAEIRYALAPSALGWVLVAATGLGVCAIELGDEPGRLAEVLRGRFPNARSVEDDPELAGWLAQVVETVEAPGRSADLPLDVRGTAFQRQVWEALRAIPAGETATYAEVAARIGRPTAARAVARACATNELAVMIPCHRVVRGDGQLGGYRWGLDRKRALLDRERGG